MNKINLNLSVSDEIMQYLQQEAEKRHVSLDEVVSEMVSDLFGEPSKEEILDNMRESLRDGLGGHTRPAREVLAELKSELGLHADES